VAVQLTGDANPIAPARPRARYGSFALLYALSQLKLRYRRAWLGRVWNLLEPMLFLAVLSVVFSVVNRADLSDYAVYLFAGLVPWRYLERAVMGSADSIAEGAWLLKRTAAPAEVLPLVAWLSATVDFAFSFVALLLMLALLPHPWTVHLLVLPLAVAAVSLVSLGTGMIFAVLNVFARDVKPLLQVGLMLLFFSSSVLIMPSTVPAGSLVSTLFDWHPLAPLVALFQKPIYAHAWPSPGDWAFVVLTGGATCALGLALIRWKARRFYFYL
jgi:ABC-type polysaccharide/polyol phosphate export permease